MLSPITKYVTWQNSIQKVCRHSSAKKCSPHFEPARSSLARKMDSATTSACRPADRGAARRQGHESSPRPRQRMCASPAEAQVGAAAAAAPVDAQGGATVTRPAPLSARSTLAAGCGVAPNAVRLMEPAGPRGIARLTAALARPANDDGIAGRRRQQRHNGSGTTAAARGAS